MDSKGGENQLGKCKVVLFCFPLAPVAFHVFISNVDEEMRKVLIKLREWH